MPKRPITRARLISVLVSLTACLTLPALARESTDSVVMKNGDRITCQIKSLDAGVLKVDLDYVDGTISIDWQKVARLESKFLFLVQLQDGSVYSGNVINAQVLEGDPIKFEIRTAGGDSPVVEKSKVVRMTQTSDTFVQRWSGKITLGASFAKGNNTTQYNIGSEFDYQQTRWGGRISLNSNLSTSTGATPATRNQLDLSSYRLLSRTSYFVAGDAGVLQSSVQQIQHQTIVAASLGRFLKNTNRVRLSVQGGMGWQRTDYTPSPEMSGTQNVAVALVSSNLQVFIFKKSQLDLTGSVAPAVNDQGRVYTKINASYYLKLFGKIDWNFSFYGNWDTQPPKHLPASDYGSSTGLSYSFGNK